MPSRPSDAVSVAPMRCPSLRNLHTGFEIRVAARLRLTIDPSLPRRERARLAALVLALVRPSQPVVPTAAPVVATSAAAMSSVWASSPHERQP